MNAQQTFQHTRHIAAALFLLAASGCITLPSREDEVARDESERATQQDLARLKQQVETILAQQDQLQQQMQQVRTVAADRITSSDLERNNTQVQARIADLDRKIAALDAARSHDRQEIVGTLSKNMSAAMAAQQKSAERTASPRSSTPAPKFSGKAYKHIVAAGDTLSAIAAAYKASPAAIISANNLKDPGHLRVGQELLIPAP